MAERHPGAGANPAAVGATAADIDLTTQGSRLRGDDVPVAHAPLREFWIDFSQNRGAVAGLAMVVALVLIAIFANAIAPHSPIEQFRDATLSPPSWQVGGASRFVLGTDALGRDLLARLVWGARASLFVGLASAVLLTALGVALGAWAGWRGGLVDWLISRTIELVLCFPAFVLVLCAMFFVDPRVVPPIVSVAVVIGIVG